jgi:hypothetical protein
MLRVIRGSLLGRDVGKLKPLYHQPRALDARYNLADMPVRDGIRLEHEVRFLHHDSPFLFCS